MTGSPAAQVVYRKLFRKILKRAGDASPGR
jgi:hypothetical protein